MRTFQALPFVGTSAIVAIATLASFPGFCVSFQPANLPMSPSGLSSLANVQISTSLDRRQHLHCVQLKLKTDDESDDGRIGFFDCSDGHVNIDAKAFENFKSFVHQMSCEAKKFAAVSALFFSIGTMGPALPAFAETEVPQQQEQQSVLLKEVSTEELEMRIKPQQPGEFESSVIDEVWALLDKYYIDRTFNSQDWKAVRSEVESQGQKVGFDDNKSMKIANDMVQSLGDKYTRMLDKEQYTAIQKYDLIGVGVTLMPNAQKDIIVGAPPIAGSASDKAGLKQGDFVTAVNGKPTRGRNAFDIIDQIGENPNSKTVTFSILRDNGPSTLDSIGNPDSSQTFDVTMQRQTMEVKDPVQYKISETRSDGTSTYSFPFCTMLLQNRMDLVQHEILDLCGPNFCI